MECVEAIQPISETIPSPFGSNDEAPISTDMTQEITGSMKDVDDCNATDLLCLALLLDPSVNSTTVMHPLCCGKLKSNTFFHYDRPFSGGVSTYLIKRAITESLLFISQLIKPRDSCYHMKIGKFVSQLTRKQREEFSIVIQMTEQ
jgi:hypothetical protein